jgi:hypothetical protein
VAVVETQPLLVDLVVPVVAVEITLVVLAQRLRDSVAETNRVQVVLTTLQHGEQLVVVAQAEQGQMVYSATAAQLVLVV